MGGAWGREGWGLRKRGVGPEEEGVWVEPEKERVWVGLDRDYGILGSKKCPES